jgi:hypothetical protein
MLDKANSAAKVLEEPNETPAVAEVPGGSNDKPAMSMEVWTKLPHDEYKWKVLKTFPEEVQMECYESLPKAEKLNAFLYGLSTSNQETVINKANESTTSKNQSDGGNEWTLYQSDTLKTPNNQKRWGGAATPEGTICFKVDDEDVILRVHTRKSVNKTTGRPTGGTGYCLKPLDYHAKIQLVQTVIFTSLLRGQRSVLSLWKSAYDLVKDIWLNEKDKSIADVMKMYTTHSWSESRLFLNYHELDTPERSTPLLDETAETAEELQERCENLSKQAKGDTWALKDGALAFKIMNVTQTASEPYATAEYKLLGSSELATLATECIDAAKELCDADREQLQQIARSEFGNIEKFYVYSNSSAFLYSVSEKGPYKDKLMVCCSALDALLGNVPAHNKDSTTWISNKTVHNFYSLPQELVFVHFFASDGTLNTCPELHQQALTLEVPQVYTSMTTKQDKVEFNPRSVILQLDWADLLAVMIAVVFLHDDKYGVGLSKPFLEDSTEAMQRRTKFSIALPTWEECKIIVTNAFIAWLHCGNGHADGIMRSDEILAAKGALTTRCNFVIDEIRNKGVVELLTPFKELWCLDEIGLSVRQLRQLEPFFLRLGLNQSTLNLTVPHRIQVAERAPVLSALERERAADGVFIESFDLTAIMLDAMQSLKAVTNSAMEESDGESEVVVDEFTYKKKKRKKTEKNDSDDQMQACDKTAYLSAIKGMGVDGVLQTFFLAGTGFTRCPATAVLKGAGDWLLKPTLAELDNFFSGVLLQWHMLDNFNVSAGFLVHAFNSIQENKLTKDTVFSGKGGKVGSTPTAVFEVISKLGGSMFEGDEIDAGSQYVKIADAMINAFSDRIQLVADLQPCWDAAFSRGSQIVLADAVYYQTHGACDLRNMPYAVVYRTMFSVFVSMHCPIDLVTLMAPTRLLSDTNYSMGVDPSRELTQVEQDADRKQIIEMCTAEEVENYQHAVAAHDKQHSNGQLATWQGTTRGGAACVDIVPFNESTGNNAPHVPLLTINGEMVTPEDDEYKAGPDEDDADMGIDYDSFDSDGDSDDDEYTPEKEKKKEQDTLAVIKWLESDISPQIPERSKMLTAVNSSLQNQDQGAPSDRATSRYFKLAFLMYKQHTTPFEFDKQDVENREHLEESLRNLEEDTLVPPASEPDSDSEDWSDIDDPVCLIRDIEEACTCKWNKDTENMDMDSDDDDTPLGMLFPQQ